MQVFRVDLRGKGLQVTSLACTQEEV